MTRHFAVVGDPVSHSMSPLIHSHWISQHKLDGDYVTHHLTTRDARAAQDIRALAHSGFSGLNITLPHKLAALEAAASISPEAKLVGAANTLALQPDGAWSADNTDVEGFALAVRLATQNADLKGKRVVLIGAGGAARAALVHLARLGASVTIVNRTATTAEALRDEFIPDGFVSSLMGLPEAAASADLVVNSASLGHAGSPLPDFPEGKGRPFFDMSYGKAAIPILKQAASAGWATHDGLPMLVGQAAAAFRLWWKISPDIEDALKACRAKLAA
jgi:shikimate dehydrogenase